MFLTLFRYALLMAALLPVFGVQAGIVLNATRVIYQAKDKEVSLGAYNSGAGEILLQTWLEPYDPSSARPEAADAREAGALPFIVTPALAHLSGDGKQLLRIIHAGHGMPTDRESVLWLNVQEIPQAARENSLQIAVRQRIKFFFRPAQLAADPALAAQGLEWRLASANVLEVFNPGPYHVSMLDIGLRQGADELARQESRMLAPRQRWQMPLKPRTGAAPVQLHFISINDFGGQEVYRARLLGEQMARASKDESG